MADIDECDALCYLSITLGWIYFFAWSLSFYGQIIENYKRQSVSGLSFDFEVYNFLGFTAYSVYTIWGYVDHNIGTGEVSIQDVVFATHAWLLTVLTIIQIFIYFDRDDPNQKVSQTCITITICLIWGALQILLIEQILGLYDPHVTKDKSLIFNSVVYLGWCKVFISFIKYIPQVYYNWRRKSTEGWSIANILLDFTGGTFSFGQNIVDVLRHKSVIIHDDQSNSLNIAKFALSIVSIVFDIIFCIQHFILYRVPESEEEKKYKNLVSDVQTNF
jgi:cystinosin